MAGGDSGPAIVPGKGAESRLIRYVAGLVEDYQMPPEDAGKPLSSEQIGVLRAWIDQGAKWTGTGSASDREAGRRSLVVPAAPAGHAAGREGPRLGPEPDRRVRPGPARARGAVALARGRSGRP